MLGEDRFVNGVADFGREVEEVDTRFCGGHGSFPAMIISCGTTTRESGRTAQRYRLANWQGALARSL